MKKIDFLIKLGKEGKLQIVEPNEDLKKAYLQRSMESLTSAKALLKIGNLKDSVALSYFSMYHCLLALLFKTGIKCENHTAAADILNIVFGKDNSLIIKSKSERIDKQYYVDYTLTHDEAIIAIKTAENFIVDLTNFIEHLDIEKIKSYRNELKKSLINH